MEQVIIQDCGCIALPESVATALDLKKGMTLDVALDSTGDSILLTPCPDNHPSADVGFSNNRLSLSSCLILPPSR
jgi:hypothetical protein